MCNKPSVPGKISTNAPKAAILVTVPRYSLPTSGEAVSALMRSMASLAFARSDEATLTLPSSSTSIFAPVSSWIPLMFYEVVEGPEPHPCAAYEVFGGNGTP